MPRVPPVTSATRPSSPRSIRPPPAPRAARAPGREPPAPEPEQDDAQRRAEPVRSQQHRHEARDPRRGGAGQRRHERQPQHHRRQRAHAIHAPGPAIQPASSKNDRGSAAPSATATPRPRRRAAARPARRPTRPCAAMIAARRHCSTLGAIGRLAQLVRAPALQAGGPRFEPGTAHRSKALESPLFLSSATAGNEPTRARMEARWKQRLPAAGRPRAAGTTASLPRQILRMLLGSRAGRRSRRDSGEEPLEPSRLVPVARP